MLATEEIKQMIESGIDGAVATVTGDGYKYEAHVVSEKFANLSMIKQHQMVYATVNEHIASGALHALSLKTEPA
jgi:acid stress-induced BolA-like protein IbaG/YrbA